MLPAMPDHQQRVLRGEVVARSSSGPRGQVDTSAREKSAWLNEHRALVVGAAITASLGLIGAIVTGIFSLLVASSQSPNPAPTVVSQSESASALDKRDDVPDVSTPHASESSGGYRLIMSRETLRVNSRSACAEYTGWVDLEAKEVTYDDFPDNADLSWETCNVFDEQVQEIGIVADKIAKLSPGDRTPAACEAALKSRPEGANA